MLLVIKLWLMMALLVFVACKDDEEQASTDEAPANVNSNGNANNNSNTNSNANNNSNANEPQGLQLTAGLQYTTDSFEAGQLTLYNCDFAQLYRVSDDGNPALATSAVELGDDRPAIVIVDAAAGCEVRINDKTYAPVQQDLEANVASGAARAVLNNSLVTAFTAQEPNNSSMARLYVSNTAGNTWHKIEQINWQGMNSSTDVSWDAKTHRNNRVMITVMDDSGNRWWHVNTSALESDVGGVKLGEGIGFAGVGGESNAQVQLAEDCGLVMFYTYTHPDRGSLEVALLNKDNAQAVPHSDSSQGTIHLLTAGTPTSMDCQPSFIINGIKLTSFIGVASPALPDTPAVAAITKAGGQIRIDTPAKPANFGNLLRLYYFGEGRSGSDKFQQWFFIYTPTWDNSYNTSSYAVGTTNKVLFKAEYIVSGTTYPRWFFVGTP